MTAHGIAKLACACAAASIALYGVTGLHFWAPVQAGDEGRAIALIGLHIAALASPIFTYPGTLP